MAFEFLTIDELSKLAFVIARAIDEFPIDRDITNLVIEIQIGENNIIRIANELIIRRERELKLSTNWIS